MKARAFCNVACLSTVLLALCWAVPVINAQETAPESPAPVKSQVIPPPPAPPQLSGDDDNGMADIDQDLQGLSPVTRDLILTVIKGFTDRSNASNFTSSASGRGRGFMDYLVIITAIILSLGFPPIVISIILFFGYKRARLRYNTVVTLAEKGVAVPNLDFDADARRSGPIVDLRRGVVALAVGVGLALFFYLLGWTGGVGLGAIPAFIGIAHLFVYYTRKSDAGK